MYREMPSQGIDQRSATTLSPTRNLDPRPPHERPPPGGRAYARTRARAERKKRKPHPVPGATLTAHSTGTPRRKDPARSTCGQTARLWTTSGVDMGRGPARCRAPFGSVVVLGWGFGAAVGRRELRAGVLRRARHLGGRRAGLLGAGLLGAGLLRAGLGCDGLLRWRVGRRGG